MAARFLMSLGFPQSDLNQQGSSSVSPDRSAPMPQATIRICASCFMLCLTFPYSDNSQLRPPIDRTEPARPGRKLTVRTMFLLSDAHKYRSRAVSRLPAVTAASSNIDATRAIGKLKCTFWSQINLKGDHSATIFGSSPAINAGMVVAQTDISPIRNRG
jgi:hypothetical protein